MLKLKMLKAIYPFKNVLFASYRVPQIEGASEKRKKKKNQKRRNPTHSIFAFKYLQFLICCFVTVVLS